MKQKPTPDGFGTVDVFQDKCLTDLEKGQTTEIEKTIGHSIHFKKHLKNCGRKLYDLKTNNFQSYNDALNFFYCSIRETFKRQK